MLSRQGGEVTGYGVGRGVKLFAKTRLSSTTSSSGCTVLLGACVIYIQDDFDENAVVL